MQKTLSPAELPGEVRLQIVSSCAEPPAGDDWLHEIKHDGHRLLAVGGKSLGAPRGERNGNYRHGLGTIEAIADRRRAAEIREALRRLYGAIKNQLP